MASGLHHHGVLHTPCCWGAEQQGTAAGLWGMPGTHSPGAEGNWDTAEPRKDEQLSKEWIRVINIARLQIQTTSSSSQGPLLQKHAVAVALDNETSLRAMVWAAREGSLPVTGQSGHLNQGPVVYAKGTSGTICKYHVFYPSQTATLNANLTWNELLSTSQCR